MPQLSGDRTGPPVTQAAPEVVKDPDGVWGIDVQSPDVYGSPVGSHLLLAASTGQASNEYEDGVLCRYLGGQRHYNAPQRYEGRLRSGK